MRLICDLLSTNLRDQATICEFCAWKFISVMLAFCVQTNSIVHLSLILGEIIAVCNKVMDDSTFHPLLLK